MDEGRKGEQKKDENEGLRTRRKNQEEEEREGKKRDEGDKKKTDKEVDEERREGREEGKKRIAPEPPPAENAASVARPVPLRNTVCSVGVPKKTFSIISFSEELVRNKEYNLRE